MISKAITVLAIGVPVTALAGSISTLPCMDLGGIQD